MKTKQNDHYENGYFFQELSKQTLKDPMSKRPAQIILWVAMIIGLIAVLVSAKIGYGFFSSVFTDFKFWGIVLIAVFELGKVTFISLYELFSERLSRVIVGILSAGRVFFVIFSIIASFSKISEYMDAPNYSAVWSERKSEMDSAFKARYEAEETALSANIKKFEDTMYIESRRFIKGQWHGPRFLNDSLNWVQAKSERLHRLDSIQTAFDNSLEEERTKVRQAPESKNQMLLGIHTTFKNAGISSENGFSRFYAWFVLVISLLVSVGLELIIWGCFAVVSRIFKDPLIARIDTFNESAKTIESVKQEKAKEDAKTFSFKERIANVFKRKASPVEALNEAVEETSKINF